MVDRDPRHVERELTEELSLALQLADAADAITLEYFESRAFTLSHKSDDTEVTQADQETEKVLRDALTSLRPDDGVYGEEFGTTGPRDSGYTWVIDPIDGTSNFARGVPVWATLIALVDSSRGPMVGVVSAPSLHRRWWAAKGSGAFLNGRAIGVSRTNTLAQSHISVTFGTGWERLGLTSVLVDLQRSCARSRGFGDFWQHMLVAEGALDIAVDAVGLAPYDNAAIQAIVEEAGGRHTDRFGVRDYEQNSAITSNGLLHDEVIARLAPS